MKKCSLIIGMHRSGTSALTGLLSSLGVFPGGELMPASPSNPKGYFENVNVYTFNKKVMDDFSCDWDSFDFEISLLSKDSMRSYIDEAKEIIVSDYLFVEYLSMKDPRLCLTFPIWAKALEELDIKIKVLFIYRNPVEVALSIKKRNNLDMEKSLILWAHYNLQAEYFTRLYDRLFISYDELIRQTELTLETIIQHLGIDISNDIIKESSKFIDEAIKNNRMLQEKIFDVPVIYDSLYSQLQLPCLDEESVDIIRKECYTSLKFYYNDNIKSLFLKKSEDEEKVAEIQAILFSKEDELSSKEDELKILSRKLMKQKKERFVDALSPNKLGSQYRIVDVIIPVFNAYEYTKNCILSVLNNDSGLLNSIIIVNDGSNEKTSSYLETVSEDNENIILINMGENQGYTKSVNKGIEASTAEYVVLLNSDTVVTSSWLEKMLSCAETDEKVGIVGPLSNAASWQSVPNLLDVSGAFVINKLPTSASISEMSELVAEVAIPFYPEVPFVNGFCFLIKRNVIDAIGLMDEDTFPIGYGEENDYCIRAVDAGFKLLIADNCYIYHEKSKSFGHDKRKKFSDKGAAALKNKHSKEKVDGLVRVIKSVQALVAVRSSIQYSILENEKKIEIDPKSIKVMFILPSPGAGGGSHSIVQEVSAMRLMGVDAKVAIEEKNLKTVLDRYKEIPTANDIFLTYKDSQNLIVLARNFDVAIATIYYSVEIVKEIISVYPYILPAYYVQDYEPMFFPKDSEERHSAEFSYSFDDSALLFAKTRWIAKQVAFNHGVFVNKVSPSIDHDVYYPSALDRRNQNRIVVAAMIRPQTPYRGAERTIKILVNLKKQFKNNIKILTFGCNSSHGIFNKFRTKDDYENLGVLDRVGVADCLRESDLFVDLSDYQAFGRTSLEAMACGCAAMLPLKGGGDEYAVDGYNALVVDTNNEEECWKKLLLLISDPQKLNKMKKAGLETSARYSPKLAALSELSLMVSHLDVLRRVSPKREKPVVSIVPVKRDDGHPVGSAFVRLIYPYTKNHSLSKNWDFVVSDSSALPAPSEADMVIIQRDALGLDLKVISTWLLNWRAAGKKFIYEFDDDLLDIDGLKIRLGGKKTGEVKQLTSVVKWLISAADAVITSTPNLYHFASEYNESVFLVPNYIDSELWGLTSKENLFGDKDDKSDVVKIGYIGTPTHDNDLEVVKEAIKRIKREYGKKVDIEIIGAFQKSLDNPMFGKAVALPKDTTYPEFVKWLKKRVDWDIAIAPLAENRFNQSKSHLKFLEYSALGLPVICSNVDSYSSIVVNGKNGLLVENNTNAWLDAIKTLVDDSLLRKKYVDSALKDLINNYTCDANVELYNKVLDGINKQSIRVELPSLKNTGLSVNVNGINSKSAFLNTNSKLYKKLLRNPYGYFSDSKHKVLRPLKFFFKKP